MPWSMNNPPPPAKNWPASKKRRCVAAANAALANGATDEEAVFACIHNAKRKVYKRVSDAQRRLYQEEMDRAKAEFSDYALDYLKKRDLSRFKSQMQEGLKGYYTRVALIAKGQKKFTELDKKDLGRFLGLIYGYLDGFIQDLGNYKVLASDQGVISRASSYGYGWGVFSRYTLPGELADMLPYLPGVSCMGGEACGCWLEYDSDDEGYHVYWYVTPLKNHCPVCTDLAIEWSPYTISKEEIVEEWGEDILDENGEIIEF